jgi:hypothetical protein
VLNKYAMRLQIYAIFIIIQKNCIIIRNFESVQIITADLYTLVQCIPINIYFIVQVGNMLQ